MSENAVKVAEVERGGTALIVPEGMSLSSAIASLEKRARFEEEVTQFTVKAATYPWDGALALFKALRVIFGWVQQEATPTMFGPKPPSLISVESGPRGQTVNVPWGRLTVPGIDGSLSMGGGFNPDGTVTFSYSVECKRKHEATFRKVEAKFRELLAAESLYRGRALKIDFAQEIPVPKFLDVAGATEDRLIFPDDVARAIQTSLFTPLRHREALKAAKIPFRRGVLLAGGYGTGKTETMFTAANLAEANGITFVYVENVKDLPKAIAFARLYAPAVIAGEDVDRIVGGSERTEELDEVLNSVDGIESKRSEILLVLTTNHPETIHPAMVRPGRLDAVIEVRRPDGPAVEALIRRYSGTLLAADADLSNVGRILAGQIPAVVREVVERAKLAALRLSEGRSVVLTTAALVESAETMSGQLDLLSRKPEPNPSDIEKLGRAVGASIERAMLNADRALYEVERGEFDPAEDLDADFVREITGKTAKSIGTAAESYERAVVGAKKGE